MGEAREVGQRWFDVGLSSDVDAMVALIAEDCDFRTPGGVLGSPHEAAIYVKAFADAFPDAAVHVDQWVEGGDLAVAEGSYTGTHTGKLAGPGIEVPPTGRSIQVPFVALFGARDGKMSLYHVYWDQMGFMAQLGLIPEPPGA